MALKGPFAFKRRYDSILPSQKTLSSDTRSFQVTFHLPAAAGGLTEVPASHATEQRHTTSSSWAAPGTQSRTNRPVRTHPHGRSGSQTPTNAPTPPLRTVEPFPSLPPPPRRTPRTHRAAPHRPQPGRSPSLHAHPRPRLPPPRSRRKRSAAIPESGAAAGGDGDRDGGLSRHGAVRSRAVAAAAEEALGPRRRLRAVPRVFPQQHLQAGRGWRRTCVGGGGEEPVCLVALMSLLAGRTDGERPEPPSGAGARAAHPMEGAVQLGERQPPEQPVPEFRAGEAVHHGRAGYARCRMLCSLFEC